MSSSASLRLFQSAEDKLSTGGDEDRARTVTRLARWAGAGLDPVPLQRLMPLLQSELLEASRYAPRCTAVVLALEETPADRISALTASSGWAVSILAKALAHRLPLLRRIARQALDANISSRPIQDILIGLLKDPRRDVRRDAADLLQNNCAALPSHLSLHQVHLKDDVAKVRSFATKSLGRQLKESILLIRSSLEDKDPEVRAHAAFALAEALDPAAEAIPALLGLLNRSRLEQRGALRPLVLLFTARWESPAAIVTCVASEDWFVSSQAAHALGAAYRALDAHRGPLLRHLRHPTPHVRTHAVGLLPLLAQEREGTVELLWEALQDSHPEVRRAAASGLHALKPASLLLLERLKVSLKRASADRKVHLALALDALDAPPPELAAILARGLSSTSSRVRLDAIRALSGLGRRAADALPEIRRILNDEDPNVRHAAVDALKAAGPAALPALKRVLRHPDEDMRRFALRALSSP